MLILRLFQTHVPNGTYEQHSIEEESSVVLTSYSGVFRAEVPYKNLINEDCMSSISYEFLPESYRPTCTGKVAII